MKQTYAREAEGARWQTVDSCLPAAPAISERGANVGIKDRRGKVFEVGDSPVAAVPAHILARVEVGK